MSIYLPSDSNQGICHILRLLGHHIGLKFDRIQLPSDLYQDARVTWQKESEEEGRKLIDISHNQSHYLNYQVVRW